MGEEKGIGAGETFLSAKDIAKRYGVSKNWAYYSPDIAHLKIPVGRFIRWRLSDLEALEAEKKERSEILAQYKKWEDDKRAKRILFGIK